MPIAPADPASARQGEARDDHDLLVSYLSSYLAIHRREANEHRIRIPLSAFPGRGGYEMANLVRADFDEDWHFVFRGPTAAMPDHFLIVLEPRP